MKHCMRTAVVRLLMLGLAASSVRSAEPAAADAAVPVSAAMNLAQIERALEAYPPAWVSGDARAAIAASLDRQVTVQVLDAMTNEDRAKLRPLLEFYRRRVDAGLDLLERTRMTDGVLALKFYSSSLVLKSAAGTVAVDFCQGPINNGGEPEKRDNRRTGFYWTPQQRDRLAALVDASFITHRHHDHADYSLARRLAARGKPVVGPAQLKALWKDLSDWITVPQYGQTQRIGPAEVYTMLGRQYPRSEATDDGRREGIPSDDPAADTESVIYLLRVGGIVFLQGAENHSPAGEWLAQGISQGWTPDVVLSVGQYQGQRSIDAVLRQRPPAFRIPVHEYELMHDGGGNRSSPAWTGAGRKAFDQHRSMPLFWGEGFHLAHQQLDSARGRVALAAGALPAVAQAVVAQAAVAQIAAPPGSTVLRLAELPGPWANPLANDPYLRLAIVRHTAVARDVPGGRAVIVEAKLKRSTDFPMPIGTSWTGEAPLDEVAVRVANLGAMEVGVSLGVLTADKRAITTAKQPLAAGADRVLTFDMLDGEPAQLPGARAKVESVWLRLHGLRAGVDYRMALRDVEFRALAAEKPIVIRPIPFQAAAGKTLRLAWEPGPSPQRKASPAARPIQLSLERNGQVFLKATTTLGGQGANAALAPLELTLPHGLPSGRYALLADTRRVPVVGQPPRRANVGTVDVPGSPPPKTVKATVAPHNGAATLHIDGRPTTALKYMTYNLDERYVRQFAETGVEIVGFGAACGEHPYGLAAESWPAPDRFDFSQLDARAARVLSAHPRAYLLVRVYVAAPKWWVREHPGECVVSILPDGKRRDYDEPAGHRPGSWASKRWRDDMGHGLERFVQHLRTSPYADRVLGLLICAGTTEEWMFAGSNFAEWADYSPPAVAGFRDWLRGQYGDEARLQAAWRDPKATFAKAAPPLLSDAMAAGTGEFIDPAKGRRLPDWWHYTSDLTADTIEHFARVAKRASHGEWLCGAFYGFVAQFSEPRILRAGHLAIDRLVRSPHLDFFSSPTLYSHRSLAAGGYSTFMSLTESYRLHNKLWWNENDLRTFRVLDVPVVTIEQVDRRQTPRETRDLLWREIGNVLAHGTSQWYFDMGGGWYDDADLLSLVRRQAEVAQTVLGRDRSSVAQVAVAVDPMAFTQQTVFSSVNNWLVLGQVAELGQMGAPFDLVSLADIEQLPPRKLWVFLNCFGPDGRDIARIHARLKRDGAVGLFVYGCGHLNSPDGPASLTGMSIVADNARRKADVRVPAAALGLKADSVYGTSSKVGPSRFEGGEITPTFSVSDPDAKVLGIDATNGRPALCRKPRDGWTSIYSAAPCVSAAVLRALAKEAGVHVYLDEDAVVYANASVLSVTVVDPGRRRIRLPTAMAVDDAISGRGMTGRAAAFDCDFQERESRLFLLSR